MVRDIMLEMDERDVQMDDKSSLGIPSFGTVWGDIFEEDSGKDIEAIICNILIPEQYFNLAVFENDELTVRFSSSYMPSTQPMRIRLVGLSDGKRILLDEERGKFGVPANSYVLSKNIAAPISACILPLIDSEGEFLVRIVRNSKSANLDKAYIYSSKETDIFIHYSDDQASQLLSLCAPGNSYRYPTTGVGITKYLNCVIDHSDLASVLDEQFEGDKRAIQEADFDNETGRLNVLFSPEKEEGDVNVIGIETLDKEFFKLFTDEYVRRNVVLDEFSDTEFINLINQYPNVLNLIMFTDDTTSVSRVDDNVVAGKFNGVGEIEPSDEYYIVTATLETNTIIMFDDELEDDVKGAPIFIINNSDETRLYTALVEQPYWLTENSHRCFILNHRAVVKYMVKQSQFKSGKGLFTVHSVSANIKNMLGLVQDVNTGRLLGIVSTNTNISDIALEEITQHIYATQISLT